MYKLCFKHIKLNYKINQILRNIIFAVNVMVHMETKI
jgi:hypothetical protein